MIETKKIILELPDSVGMRCVLRDLHRRAADRREELRTILSTSEYPEDVATPIVNAYSCFEDHVASALRKP